jgi:hypothetical protein
MVEDVDAAIAIDKDSREAACVLIGEEGQFQHQRISALSQHGVQMVLVPPRNGTFELIHVLWDRRHDGIHLNIASPLAALVVALANEDMVVLNIGRVLIAPRRLQAPAAGAGANHHGYLPATVAEPVGLRLGL